jgi:hypothetical protein
LTPTFFAPSSALEVICGSDQSDNTNSNQAAGRHRIIALTNNFSKQFQDPSIPKAELEFLGRSGETPVELIELFDDYCDSSIIGMRYFLAVFAAHPVIRSRTDIHSENQNGDFI